MAVLWCKTVCLYSIISHYVPIFCWLIIHPHCYGWNICNYMQYTDTYIFHVVFFRRCSKRHKFKSFLFLPKKRCCKNVSPRGRVMPPFGRAMSPLQNHIFGIIWKISKNTVPQKKGCSFGNPIFRSKGRNLAPFWRYRYIYIYTSICVIYMNIHPITSPCLLLYLLDKAW